MERRRRDAWRRRFRRAALGIAATLGVVLCAGLALPDVIGMSGELVLNRPPETIWRVLTDFDGMPLWRSDLTALERLPDLDGRPAWREIRRGRESSFELAVAEPPNRLVFRRTRAGRPALPSSTFQLSVSGGRTVVTLTQVIQVRNPLRRVWSRLHPPRAALLRLLRDLGARVGGGVQRQVAAVPG